jgi:hypothetical protein
MKRIHQGVGAGDPLRGWLGLLGGGLGRRSDGRERHGDDGDTGTG